jgi:hypothetical protein
MKYEIIVFTCPHCAGFAKGLVVKGSNHCSMFVIWENMAVTCTMPRIMSREFQISD